MTQMNSNTGTPSPSPVRQPTPPQQQANVPLILIAVALGLVTVIATNWYVQKIKTERDLNMVTVYRLNRPVEPGQEFKPDDVIEYQVPGEFKESVVDGMSMIREDELSVQIGKDFRRYAKTNAPLTWDLFTAPGQGGADAVTVAEGQRAIPIPVSKDTAPAFLEPGMMVDINATLTPPGRKTETKLVMERVRVIAVGDRTQAAPGARNRSYNTITIEVSPQESRALSTIRRYAEDERFEIVYRDSGDNQIEIESATIDPNILRVLGLEPITDN